MPSQESALAMWNVLLKRGVYLNLALPPATPDSRPLLRSSVSAAHTEAQIDTVLEIFAQVGRELGVLTPAAQRASA
jgi:8-amino-7-oxononanoate synthase